MDTLRGPFSDGGEVDSSLDPAESPVDRVPPPQFGRDERRMQVRAYNFWAGLLEDRNLPDIARLHPEQLPDFGPFGILLDFTAGIENPGIGFLGDKLADECEAHGPIRTLADVPSRSLLSRITDHYMQILANQAPIGFEAEFVNQRGATILYRGILLPFSSDGEAIDHIFGVINWKELSEPAVEALELTAADEVPADNAFPARDNTPMAGWADGPVSLGGSAELPADDRAFPAPGFGFGAIDAESADLPGGFETEDFPIGYDMAPEDMGLADWLFSAREGVREALGCEERSRHALYAAVSRAWDFASVALASPQDLAELAEDAGIAVNPRAPLTMVVKLVFGADYDKTRLAEFTAVLAHAQRLDLAPGTLEAYLADAPGGLKGVVREERLLRKIDRGLDADNAAESAATPHQRVLSRLRTLEPRPLETLGRTAEFSLLLARRLDDGTLVMLGEVADDETLIDKAARHLID